MKAILDAGALVAVDRRNRLTGAQLRVLQQQGTPVRVSSAVMGQVWRDGRKQANLVRPVLIVVGLVAFQDSPQVGRVPYEGAVQELAPTSADPAFGDCVHAGRPDVAEHGRINRRTTVSGLINEYHRAA